MRSFQDGACASCEDVVDLPADFSRHPYSFTDRPNNFDYHGTEGLNTVESQRYS